MTVVGETAGRAAAGIEQDALHATPLVDINRAFLTLLIEIASRNGAQAIDFITDHGVSLEKLSETEKVKIARTPFLLIDIEFRNHLWWKAVSRDSGKAQAVREEWLRPLPREPAIKLVRAVLMLVWHLSRTDQESCRVLMGMNHLVTGIIANMQPGQIDRIAERHYAHLRPRWEDRPYLWRQLIESAGSHEATTRAFALRALQLSWASTVMP